MLAKAINLSKYTRRFFYRYMYIYTLFTIIFMRKEREYKKEKNIKILFFIRIIIAISKWKNFHHNLMQ